MAALACVGVASAATPTKTGLPTSCASFMSLAAASAATGEQVVGVTQQPTGHFNGTGGMLAGVACNLVVSPATNALDQSTVVEFSLYAFSSPAAAKQWFAHFTGPIAASAPAKIAKYPPCQPSWPGTYTVEPSDCAVLHPFGSSSFQFAAFGLVYTVGKYALADLSLTSDAAEVGVAKAAMALLPK